MKEFEVFTVSLPDHHFDDLNHEFTFNFVVGFQRFFLDLPVRGICDGYQDFYNYDLLHKTQQHVDEVSILRCHLRIFGFAL